MEIIKLEECNSDFMGGQNTILDDWVSMSKWEKKFVIRVRNNPGLKYGAEPFYYNPKEKEKEEDYSEQVFLPKMPEKLDFIKVTGSYSWKPTRKFWDLEDLLFKID